MNRLQRAAIVTALAEKLNQVGSWTGETHLQKALYFLQQLLGADMGYDFVMYKHGPFSFDLREELTALTADGLLEVTLRPAPYGPSLLPTDSSRRLRESFGKTLATHAAAIDRAASIVGDQGVGQLEQLATALYMRLAFEGVPDEELAVRIHDLKPHVSSEAASAALSRLDEVIGEVRRGGGRVAV
jgi:uncharacterized protein YwgA